uniref:JmjC domain-containing protein n=1 Tax=Sexangularia sp. CB-2014 TaxID=1486929 RepID=A0A7S1V4U4_9EUKA
MAWLSSALLSLFATIVFFAPLPTPLSTPNATPLGNHSDGPVLVRALATNHTHFPAVSPTMNVLRQPPFSTPTAFPSYWSRCSCTGNRTEDNRCVCFYPDVVRKREDGSGWVKDTSRAQYSRSTPAKHKVSLLALLAAEATQFGSSQLLLQRAAAGSHKDAASVRMYASVAVTDRQSVDSVAILEALVPHAPPLLDALLATCNGMQLFVWMTETPVAASLHVDVAASVNVQLAGSKEWLLVPPGIVATDGLLYPWLHPQRRQSQLGLATALASLPGAVRVRTNPGDSLYVPPFWGHHVVAADAPVTTNLNVWCRSQPHALVTTAIQSALLPVADWPSPTRQVALALLLPPVLRATLTARHIRHLLDALRARYKPFAAVDASAGQLSCRWQPVHVEQVRVRLSPHLGRAVSDATASLALIPTGAVLPLLLAQQWVEEVTGRTHNTTDLAVLARAFTPQCMGLQQQ